MVVLSTFPPPPSGIKCQQPLTKLFMNEKEIGTGTLYIATSHLSWVDGVSGKGISVQYEHITLHAVSKDFNIHPDECLYLMLDTKLEFGGDVAEDDESEDDEYDEPAMTEIRFVPDDKDSLQAMFTAMSQCQALHPDPQDSVSEDDEIFEDAEEEGEYNPENVGGDGPSVLNGGGHVGHQLTFNGDNQGDAMEMDGQFEDADE